MPKRKYDWDGEVAVFLKMKADNPALTHEDFYRSRRLNAKVARDAIGVRLTAEWGKVQAAASAKVRKEAADQLASIATFAVKAGEALASDGLKAIFGKDMDGKGAKVKIQDYRDAEAAIRTGTAAMLKVAELLRPRGDDLSPIDPDDGFVIETQILPAPKGLTVELVKRLIKRTEP